MEATHSSKYIETKVKGGADEYLRDCKGKVMLCVKQKIMPMTKKTKTSQIYAYTNLEGGKKKFSIYRRRGVKLIY